MLRPSGYRRCASFALPSASVGMAQRYDFYPFRALPRSTHHGTNSLADFRELSFRDVASHSANDAATGRDQPMRQKETLLRQSTREKIRFVDRYRIFMRQGLAGDLAEQHIPAVQHSQNKSGTNLLATEIRKWERHSHRIACYKSFHASSSSAEVQSEAHAV